MNKESGMKKIMNPSLIKKFYEKYDVKKLFSCDMFEHIILLEFNRQEYFCKENEELEYLFFLVKGKAKACATLSNGKSFLMSFYRPFQVVGDIEFAKNTPTTGAVQALCKCYCLCIPMNKAREYLTTDSKFLGLVAKSLASKLEDISKNSSINLLYPLEERLASYISMVATPNRDKCNSYRVFDENLTYLSELLGTSYRHLLRTLTMMCEKGVLHREKGHYEVISEKALNELAGDLFRETHFL